MLRTWVAIVLMSASPALAAAGAGAHCPKLAWSDTKSASPSVQDLDTLACWNDAGDPVAGYMLASLIKVGRGRPADPVAARELFKTLAEGRGETTMAGAMGGRTYSYAMDVSNQPVREVVVPPYPPAMRELAKMMLLGEGGATDVPSAKAWLGHARSKDKEAGVLLDALVAKGY